MKVGFLTLGCKVNYYETQKLAQSFFDKGFKIVEFSEAADVYVINTCSVTNIADRKSRQMLHRARKNNPDALVVATGCYVDAAAEKKPADEAIDIAIANSDKERTVEIVLERLKADRISYKVVKETDVSSTLRYEGSRTRAFIKIQDGCNQFCSYCLIPYVRGGGRLSSRPVEDVVAEIKKIADTGVKEAVLTGIHLSSYGVDFSEEKNFVKLNGRYLTELIKRLSDIEGIKRIRLGSLEPRIITESFISTLKASDKLCPHFHLSLQSGCDDTLKRMNRHYDTKLYSEGVELIRDFYADPAITTDVIVGFPGETDEEFDTTREFIEKTGFSDIHVFQFSKREGTRAQSMPDQIPSEIKKQRSEQIIAIADRLSKTYAQKFSDKPQNILFEEITKIGDDRYLTGFNTRYVRFGVREEKAAELGISSGDIVRVSPENHVTIHGCNFLHSESPFR